jgi:hypothetical protein
MFPKGQYSTMARSSSDWETKAIGQSVCCLFGFFISTQLKENHLGVTVFQKKLKVENALNY